MRLAHTKQSMRHFPRALGQKQEKKMCQHFILLSGTSIGAINAAILVSYVKENKPGKEFGERLVEFWEYLSTQSCVENIPYFTRYWDSWHKLDKRTASGESARRYFSTKEFILKGVPNVFVPKDTYVRQQIF